MDGFYYSYCRLCAELKQANQLCDIQEDVHKISIKLNRINAISNFVGGNLPKTICFKCMSALNDAFQFVIAVEKAQLLLVDKINENQLKTVCDGENQIKTIYDSENQVKILCDNENQVKTLCDNENQVKTLCDNENQLKTIRDNKNERSFYVPVVIKTEVFVGIKEEISHSDEQLSYDDGFLTTESMTVEPNNEEPRQTPERKIQNRKVKGKMKPKNDSLSSKPSLTWKDYSWTCSECETMFTSQCELSEHSMQVHNICNAYRCSDCNIRKENLNKFMKHVRQHKKFLRFSCYKCFKEFTGPRKIYKHKCYGESDHVCKGCNTTFQTEEELSKHFSAYFRDLRVFQPYTSTDFDKVDLEKMSCKICEKVYKSRRTLFNHVTHHSDRNRNHVCETCGKSFFNKYSLMNHVTAHTEKRPFQCDICKQGFKTRTQIMNHVKSHDLVKQFACDKCGRRFRLKHQLSSHSIIHTDLMPHVCPYCKKAFRFKTILVQHLRLHTGVKPYSCDVCDRDFTNWSNYNKHMKRRHNKDMSKKKPSTKLTPSLNIGASMNNS